MTKKKQRRRLSKWRKEMLINGGIANSGSQSAVTQGNDLSGSFEEIDKENVIAHSYDGGCIFKDDAIWTPLDID